MNRDELSRWALEVAQSDDDDIDNPMAVRSAIMLNDEAEFQGEIQAILSRKPDGCKPGRIMSAIM
jgi:hypothetical protein